MSVVDNNKSEIEWQKHLQKLAREGAELDDEFFKRRRGKVGTVPQFGLPGQSQNANKLSESASEKLDRFVAIASGSQPAVIKVTSYGGGERLSALVNYVSRNAEIALEDEQGKQLSRSDLSALQADWSSQFSHNSDSRDIGVFEMELHASGFQTEEEMHQAVRGALSPMLGDRRYVYSLSQPNEGTVLVSGVTVLRDSAGERLSGDDAAAEILNRRYSAAGRSETATFRFKSYGNGVDYGTAKVRALVDGPDGDVRDQDGGPIIDREQAGKLVQRHWRKLLYSRQVRDLMHLVVSARAGTDPVAFEAAAREFLQEQFAEHRFVFSQHDPFNDPKEEGEGGKRPHIHVHAVIVTKSDAGHKLRTSPAVFAQWRKLMAEKARSHGIAMEVTDRREFASPPAFSKNQVKPVATVGRTLHRGTSPAAQSRYDSKRQRVPALPKTPQSLEVVKDAIEIWGDLARFSPDDTIRKKAQIYETIVKVSLEIQKSYNADAQKHVSNLLSNMVTYVSAEQEGHDMNNVMQKDYEQRKTNVDTAYRVAEEQIRLHGLDPEKILKPVQDAVDLYMADLALVAAANEKRQAQQAKGSEAQTQAPAATVAQTATLDNVQSEILSELSDESSEAAKLRYRTIQVRQAASVANQLRPEAAHHEPEQSTDANAPAGEVSRVEGSPIAAIANNKPETPFPDHFTSTYFIKSEINGARVYADRKEKVELFQAGENRLRSKVSDEKTISIMLDTAAHRGWTSIDVKGSKEFRQAAWIEGQARGIAVNGYTPTELDWQAVHQREEPYLTNEIRPGNVREKTISNLTTSPVKDTRDAGVSKDDAIETTTITTTRGHREGVKGILIEVGSRPYQDKEGAERSPYATVDTQFGGTKTLWGVDIPRALDEASAKPGDEIVLLREGVEPVPKTIIKEVNGQKVREDVIVDRVVWSAEVTEKKLEVAKPAVDTQQKENNNRTTEKEQKSQKPDRLAALQSKAQRQRGKDEQER